RVRQEVGGPPRRVPLVLRPADFAAPGAGLLAPGLDEGLEAGQVALGPGLHDAELVAGLLQRPLGLELQLEHDLALAVAQAVEGDDTAVGRPFGAAPRDPLVGDLLGDLGVPLPALPGDLGHPVDLLVAQLAD